MAEPAPYSIRLSVVQRDSIRTQARGMKMSDATWIRHRLFSDTASKTQLQKTFEPLSHNKDLAQLLYLLGQSRIAYNLNQIAKAVNMGTIAINAEVYAQLDEAYHMVVWMRRTLIKAQGLTP